MQAGSWSTYGRRRLHFIIAFALTVVLVFLVLRPSRGHWVKLSGLYTPPQETQQHKSSPPTYEKLRQWEDNLPQHHLDLPFPEGRTGRYVKFSNQIVMLGWNNVLNEVLMNAHLAYESNRAYVFQDYIWKPEYYPWPEDQRHQNPPHTPLGALIAGSVVGWPWDEGNDAPRSISAKWFDVVCPEHERRIIRTGDEKPNTAWQNGDQVFAYWAKLLRNASERCVEIRASGEDKFPQIFDLWLWGCERILPLWEIFSNSPTSRLLATSPIVDAAVRRNEYLFLPQWSHLARLAFDPYSHMLAMHVRRGDFKAACVHLATYNSTFYSWNLLPSLPDPLKFPSSIIWNTTEYHDAHLGRCLPEPEAIIRKARISRNEYIRASFTTRRTLDVVYLLTNEKGEWLARMKAALRRDGWNTVVTSNDLELDNEGIDTAMAIDMDIARKAAVFIGNGWSSFTSNIVHRRLIDGKEPISIRFW